SCADAEAAAQTRLWEECMSVDVSVCERETYAQKEFNREKEQEREREREKERERKGGLTAHREVVERCLKLVHVLRPLLVADKRPIAFQQEVAGPPCLYVFLCGSSR